MLIGKTGAGKSFLSNAFYGSFEPSDGPFAVAKVGQFDRK